MKALEDLCEVLEGQVKKISMKGDAISPQELDNAYKAVDIIKDIETIKAMKKAEEEQERGGYSQAQDYSYGSMRKPYFHMYPSYDRGGSYEGSYDSYDMSRDSYEQGGQSNARRGRDGDGDGRYSEDYSGRRGRDARTGRYVSRDGGSYEGGSYEGYSGHNEQQKEQMKRQIQEMQQKLNQM